MRDSPMAADSADLTGDTCKHQFIGRCERGEADRTFLPRKFTDSKSDAAIGTKATGNRDPADRSPLVPSTSSRGEEGYVAGLNDQVHSIAGCLRFRAEAGAVKGDTTTDPLERCRICEAQRRRLEISIGGLPVLAAIYAGTSGTGHAVFVTSPGIGDSTVAKIRCAR